MYPFYSVSIYALIAAAGSSSRMNLSDGSKLLLPLAGQTVLSHALHALLRSGVIEGIGVALPTNHPEPILEEVTRAAGSLKVVPVPGGASRQESVYRVLTALEGVASAVLIHDGARPLCPPELVREVTAAMKADGAAIPAVPVKATLKRAEGSFIKNTEPRSDLWEAQTPQAFQYPLIREAHERALQDGYIGTDDSELVERLGRAVRIVPGAEENIKITTPGDLALAEALLRRAQ